jgi:hypothetical protein
MVINNENANNNGRYENNHFKPVVLIPKNTPDLSKIPKSHNLPFLLKKSLLEKSNFLLISPLNLTIFIVRLSYKWEYFVQSVLKPKISDALVGHVLTSLILSTTVRIFTFLI